MAEIHKVNKAACKYLVDYKPHLWARCYFSGAATCDAVENDMCETFNGSIVDARCKSLIYMLEDIRLQVIVRMQKRRDAIKESEGMFYSKARLQLEKNKEQHRFWATTFNEDKKFEVKNGANGYVANFGSKTCTCRIWEISGIPCPHDISAIYYMKDDPDKYVSS